MYTNRSLHRDRSDGPTRSFCRRSASNFTSSGTYFSYMCPASPPPRLPALTRARLDAALSSKVSTCATSLEASATKLLTLVTVQYTDLSSVFSATPSVASTIAVIPAHDNSKIKCKDHEFRRLLPWSNRLVYSRVSIVVLMCVGANLHRRSSTLCSVLPDRLSTYTRI